MNTDSKSILRVLAAADTPGGLRPVGGIAIDCAIGREDAERRLRELQQAGLVEIDSFAWRLTPKGRNHVETRMA